ncbi:MAG: hypothetical protein HBSAPP03_13430 [Phycisphaerae bacterium]|nr:MAG: hypothetical protein HBSAPP03_13430 [Phycisphaerae bacterium]
MKMLGALAGLMKNKDKVQEAARRTRAKLESTRVVGEAGGGAARAVVRGTMMVERVELSPALLTGMAADERTRELAAGLIAQAVNAGLVQARQRLHEAINAEAKELGLEGVVPDLANFMGP